MGERLAKLLCNYGEENADIDQILAHMEASVTKVLDEIYSLSEVDDEKLMLYGPYLGRALLELSATALLTKLDPLRMLIAKGKQGQPNYEMDKPQKGSLRWQGDVFDSAVSDLWKDGNLNNPTRAIFGAYSVELVLKKSAQKLMDEVDEASIGEWYQSLTEHDAEALVEKLKSKFGTLYSFLSKGIHHELVIPLASALDRDTVITKLNDAIWVVSTLGLVVSFVPHAYARADSQTSFGLYKSIKSLEAS